MHFCRYELFYSTSKTDLLNGLGNQIIYRNNQSNNRNRIRTDVDFPHARPRIIYYFGIRAVDRFGFRGEMSDAVSIEVLPPLHNSWCHWSNWNRCQVETGKTCGKSGRQNKHRICNCPAPKNGGNRCHGRAVASRKCPLPASVQCCTWSGVWSAWSTSGDPRKRFRTCWCRQGLSANEICSGITPTQTRFLPSQITDLTGRSMHSRAKKKLLLKWTAPEVNRSPERAKRWDLAVGIVAWAVNVICWDRRPSYIDYLERYEKASQVTTSGIRCVFWKHMSFIFHTDIFLKNDSVRDNILANQFFAERRIQRLIRFSFNLH